MLKLLQQPALLMAVLENMQEGFSVVDATATQVFVNGALCRMTGFTREELLGKGPPYPYWPAEELEAIDAAFQETLAGRPHSYELTFLRKDGARFPVVVSPSTLQDEQGSVVAYCATVKDIGERKRLEQALFDSEQRWRSIASNPFDFVVVIDREYRFTFVNHPAPGISREELIGKASPLDFVDPQYRPMVKEAYDTTFATGRASSYDVQVPQLGTWYSNIVGPIFEDGKVTSVSILTRDITAQKRAEEALERSERELRERRKMETVGTLAGGIAHDLNNMLTPILGFAELAQHALGSDHPLQNELGAIVDGAGRARDLVQRILLFSRRAEPHKSVLDLRGALATDVQVLRGSLPANVELLLDLPAAPLFVLADRTQMSQVFSNLTTNAIHAVRPTRGTVRISLRQVEVAGDGGASAQAELSVSDSGPGMDQETRRRAFEPFFTTKPTGTGTGLGLAIVHGIVADHGGAVTLESALGEGTVFSVRLPLADPPAESAEANASAAPAHPLTPRSLRVLCVDDENAVLVLVHAALQSRGHAVTTLGCPQEALELFRVNPDAFDIVVSDQTMPRLTGTELVSAIRALRPELPCLLITGFEDPETEQRAAQLGVSEVVHKPFSIEQLRTAVERAVAL